MRFMSEIESHQIIQTLISFCDDILNFFIDIIFTPQHSSHSVLFLCTQVCTGTGSIQPCSLAASQTTPHLRTLQQSQDSREQKQPEVIQTRAQTDLK